MRRLAAALFLAALPASADVRLGDGRTGAVQTLADEDYVADVVQSETGPGWPDEALKVQAVVVRTYLERNRTRHASDGYDLCNLAHCQVRRGPAGPAARRAAEATRGEILTVDGAPADVVFHAACGGRTAAPRDVWPQGRSTLPGVSDASSSGPWCRRSPDFTWTTRINEPGLQVLMSPAWETSEDSGPTGVRVLQKDSSGRVLSLLLNVGGKTYRTSGELLCMSWGRTRKWHDLKSALFTVEKKGDRFVFQGFGLGHGAGLCQWGALTRAQAGHGHREILEHYFPTAEIRQLPQK